MAEFPVHNCEGKRVGAVQIPKALEGPVNADLLWQAVRMYRANQRQGTASAKTRAEVSGGGSKPWRQKHTGRARAGSSRSPIWVKGGVVFGPKPRSYRYSLPQQLRHSALVHSLKDKVASGSLAVLESIKEMPPKTKVLAALLDKLQGSGRILVVVDEPSKILARASRNLREVSVKPASDLNCYDVLAHSKLVMTAPALKQLGGAQK